MPLSAYLFALRAARALCAVFGALCAVLGVFARLLSLSDSRITPNFRPWCAFVCSGVLSVGLGAFVRSERVFRASDEIALRPSLSALRSPSAAASLSARFSVLLSLTLGAARLVLGALLPSVSSGCALPYYTREGGGAALLLYTNTQCINTLQGYTTRGKAGITGAKCE